MAPDAPKPQRWKDEDAQRFVRSVGVWVKARELAVELYEACLNVAEWELSRDLESRAKPDPRDLVFPFLAWIRRKHGYGIRSITSLRNRFRSFWTEENNPGGHELWEILSHALHVLAKEGKVRRVDNLDKPTDNSQWAKWTSGPPEADEKWFDLAAFEEACRGIPFFPEKKQPEAPYDGKVPKVLSPEDGLRLVLMLLEAAGGPLLMRDLHHEACKHVLLRSFVEMEGRRVSSDESGEQPGPGELRDDEEWVRHSDLEWIDHESLSRSKRIWETMEEKGFRKLFCGYLVPKIGLKEKKPLKEMGVSQRAHEEKEKVLRWLKQELSGLELNPDTPHTESAEAHLKWEIQSRTVARLMEMCREKED